MLPNQSPNSTHPYSHGPSLTAHPTLKPMVTSVTVDELKWFHSIDRRIFTVLVINLGRDIAESMRIIGLWLWLEEMGHPNIILQMLSFTDTHIDLVAREAVLCLNCIDKRKSPTSNEIPFTRKLMKREISLSFFSDNRVSAVRMISQFLSEIGPKTFNDIVEKAIKHQSRATGSHGGLRPIGPSTTMGSPNSAFRAFMSASSSGASQDERTIFVTFSRGYPVSESELRDFFNRNYGKCVESIYMQEVSPNQQALFARVVLGSNATMAYILRGRDEEGKVKLSINGKQARLRKHTFK